MLLQDTIGIYSKAASSELCDLIIQKYERALKENNTYEGMTGSGVQKQVKNSRDFNLLSSVGLYPELQPICNQLSGIFNTCIQDYVKRFPHQDKYNGDKNFASRTSYEIFQVQRYARSEGHYNAWHHEVFNLQTSRRFFAFLLYLNDVQEGGETEFLYTGQKIKPEKGKVLLHPASFPYVHKGHMPLTQDKTIVISWLSFAE